MTKQCQRINLFLIFTGILSFIPFLGASIVNYYTRTRMGMLRHIVFMNTTWEEKYPIATIKTVGIIAVLLILILGVYFIWLKKVKSKNINLIGKLIFLTTLASGYYIITQNKDSIRSYYIAAIFIFIGVLTVNLWYYVARYLTSKSKN